MNHVPKKIAQLLFAAMHNTLSAEQRAELDAWLSEGQGNVKLKDELQDKTQLAKALTVFDDIESGKSGAWEKLKENIAFQEEAIPQKGTLRSNALWWAAACVLLLAFSTLSLLYYKEYYKNASKAYLPVVRHVTPGKMGAIVTLADGREILLDTVKNGEVRLQGGLIARVIDGTLVYPINAKSEINTISTSRGRHYQFVLPDGTKVWLNAASSIRFPTHFDGVKREVQMTGEVYFEVAKDSGKPFRVLAPNQLEVVVLGTHFNVNGYANESNVVTTLLEGSVLLKHKGEERSLKPRETGAVGQYSSGLKSTIVVKSGVDINRAIAWKNGLFNFEGARLDELMNQLERWYDIDVVFEGEVPPMRFFGEISRSETLETVLASLQRDDIHFRLVEGRRLLVKTNY